MKATKKLSNKRHCCYDCWRSPLIKQKYHTCIIFLKTMSVWGEEREREDNSVPNICNWISSCIYFLIYILLLLSICGQIGHGHSSKDRERSKKKKKMLFLRRLLLLQLLWLVVPLGKSNSRRCLCNYNFD